ncbi:hypothetical protein COCMIDRAFT_38804 [Bipolaris oryzae ATCC 44560]|uniref:Uncharacterized protein n=1 Tax=Bipolaris oryzae ATCC 44560 TaxID=930090 RepID=W6YUU1_COCMI|nr:uncharacterized protein COCMIDRAFT_38804 [Bipolaris oryzae ATCC 44560]EUC43197.1 hypothetical protein COCMIDRAFT_38804 [Bipolaris oryzae ATCC 44560]
MFVPRALRLKGVREKPRPNTSNPSVSNAETDRDEALVKAMQNTRTTSLTPQPEEQVDQKAAKSGPRFTVKPVTPEYIAQLAAGIELIFTDYAHQEEERAQWLRDRYRTVDGEEKYIHLTAILEHPNISSLKPEASQVLLQQALRDHPSKILEVSNNGYHIRRKPSSYPPKYLPHNSFEVVDDDGLAFWDQRTIYVEPHVRNLCQTPAKVAQWLTEHGQLRPKWLPVQAVHTLWNSCAFVVLSGSVMHEDVWQKWREADKPENWKIMTKVEHTKRTAEYIALLEKQNPRGMRRTKIVDSELPPIARPAVLPLAVKTTQESAGNDSQQGKKKRKRRKPNKSALNTGDADADDTGNEPNSKRRG